MYVCVFVTNWNWPDFFNHLLNSNQFSNESLKEATEFSFRIKNRLKRLFLLMFYGWRIFSTLMIKIVVALKTSYNIEYFPRQHFLYKYFPHYPIIIPIVNHYESTPRVRLYPPRTEFHFFEIRYHIVMKVLVQGKSTLDWSCNFSC